MTQRFDLEDKVALITGGSHGLGGQMALVGTRMAEAGGGSNQYQQHPGRCLSHRYQQGLEYG